VSRRDHEVEEPFSEEYLMQGVDVRMASHPVVGRSRIPYHTAEKTTMVWPRQKDARGENTKINYGLDTVGEKEKRKSKKNVDGGSISSHDNKKFRTRSMEKQRGMAFGFRKTATAVKKNRTDR